MKSASSWAPANISFIFQIVKGEDSSKTGSRGLGCTLSDGAKITASRHGLKRDLITYNRKEVNFPAVENIISSLMGRENKDEKVRIDIISNFPLGAGFGMSGASALGSAYALNELFSLGMDKKKLAHIAHCAEVDAKTGLGDVVNQFYGGLLVKLEPSYRFAVKRIKTKERVLYCRFFSKIKTSSIIGDEKERENINKAAKSALISIKKMIKKEKNQKLSEIIGISKVFAQESGLLKDQKVKNIINSIEKKGGSASMIMLGNAVVSDIPFKGSMKAMISNKGAQ